MAEEPAGLTLTSMGGSAGKKVLFIHGFGADKQSWVGNAPAVFDVAEALTLDLPGHGDASFVAAPQEMQLLADRVIDCLVANGGDKCHWVGHSVGGSIAMLCASARPELVESLTLIAPAGLGHGVSREFTQKLTALEDKDQAYSLLLSLVNQPRLIAKPLAGILLSQLERPGVRSALRNIARAIDESGAVMEKSMSSIVQNDIRRQIIWGLQDRINAPQENNESEFAGNWIWLENCGHLPHIEHRVVVNNAIREFID